jgi:tetratricopeptide (TPR) repeat protein
VDEAIAHFETALDVSLDAQINLGIALLQKGMLDEAIPHLEKAAALSPNSGELQVNLGAALVQKGRFDDAIPHFEKVLALDPDSAEARFFLGNAFYLKGRIAEALAHWRKVLAAEPNDLRVLNQAAWVLATNPEAPFRNGAEAVELAERAVRVSGGRQPRILATLAASYAEAGQFSKAIETARRALDLATQQNTRQLAEGLNAMIALYQANTPFREKQ